MKIVNKNGEVVAELSTPKPSAKSFAEKSIETDKRIQERGNIQDVAKTLVKDKSVVKKGIAGLELASAPLNAIESGISNPMLQMQKGNVNPQRLMQEAILGMTLQKQGQYGDIMKNAGYNPIIADAGGLVLNLSPIKVFSAVAKTFGSISKMSDKALEKTGKNLLDAVVQSRDAVGKKVTQEFAKGADNVPVDGIKFVEAISELPAPVMKKAEIAFGQLQDYANGLTVGKLREFTRFIGKLKPNDFGKVERGLAETIEVKDLTRSYGKAKNLMYETLKDKSSGIDIKTADYLMELEGAFHDVHNAGRFIRKTIVDTTLNKPTKVGEFASQVASEGNTTARTALNLVKKASFQSRNSVNKAMHRIESYNRWQKEKQIAGRFFNAATYGGIGGGIGGRVLKATQEKE